MGFWAGGRVVGVVVVLVVVLVEGSLDRSVEGKDRKAIQYHH